MTTNTHKSAVDKAREKAQAQMTSAEKHKQQAEFEHQEAMRILAEQLKEKKLQKEAQRNQKIKDFLKKVSAEKHESLKAQMKLDWLYAQKESLHITIGLSMVITLIVLLLL